MVKGDAKKMSPEFLQGGAFTGYGTSLYVGLGVPIPILNEGLAKKTGIQDKDILTDIIDYSVPRRDRPKFGQVSYKELKSGSITVNGKESQGQFAFKPENGKESFTNTQIMD